MADITCEVIKDLLPLYVDDVLSPDSRAIVETHLGTCESCTECYHLLKTPERNNVQMKNADDKAALKKIKGTIKKRRLITVLITAICIAALAFGLFQGFVLHEKYISYEDSGLYVSDEALRTDRGFYKSTGFYSPDGETLFLFMTTTAYVERSEKGDMHVGTPVVGLDKASLTTTLEDDDGQITEQVCKEIYYVPEETAKQLKNIMMKWPNEEDAQKNLEKVVEEMKTSSILVWSAEE